MSRLNTVSEDFPAAHCTSGPLVQGCVGLIPSWGTRIPQVHSLVSKTPQTPLFLAVNVRVFTGKLRFAGVGSGKQTSQPVRGCREIRWGELGASSDPLRV